MASLSRASIACFKALFFVSSVYKSVIYHHYSLKESLECGAYMQNEDYDGKNRRNQLRWRNRALLQFLALNFYVLPYSKCNEQKGWTSPFNSIII